MSRLSTEEFNEVLEDIVLDDSRYYRVDRAKVLREHEQASRELIRRLAKDAIPRSKSQAKRLAAQGYCICDSGFGMNLSCPEHGPNKSSNTNTDDSEDR